MNNNATEILEYLLQVVDVTKLKRNLLAVAIDCGSIMSLRILLQSSPELFSLGNENGRELCDASFSIAKYALAHTVNNIILQELQSAEFITGTIEHAYFACQCGNTFGVSCMFVHGILTSKL